MNVDGKIEPACLFGDVVKDEILKRFIVICRRNSTSNEASVGRACSLNIRSVEVEQTQVRRFVLESNNTLLLLTFYRCGHYLRQIFFECWRQAIQPKIGDISLQ